MESHEEKRERDSGPHIKFQLPVVSSIRVDGTRNTPQPADVHGRFITARRIVFALLIALWIALPWIKMGGHPAILLDMPGRKFYLFGATFNAQDFWMVFFLATGFAFTIAFTTALLGRVWCAWACPQTVFLEFIFRPIQRLVEGPREKRIKLADREWDLEKTGRRILLHVLYIAASLGVAHIFLSYFVALPDLWRMIQSNPAKHPEAFGWVMTTAGLMYFNFSWFREQLCLVVCPYGRLQSVLIDADSKVVGYDVKRGEPRGKASDRNAGDCVDCGRCTAVCPTAIDIRNGLQLDCIGCTQCVDACDEVMDKLHRPRGLIRIDSLNGLAGKPRRIWRARIGIYIVLLGVGALVAFFALRTRRDFELNVLRIGQPYTLDGDVIRNAFNVKIVNKLGSTEDFNISVQLPAGQTGHIVLPVPTASIPSFGNQNVPMFLEVRREEWRGGFSFDVTVQRKNAPTDVAHYTSKFLGPDR